MARYPKFLDVTPIIHRKVTKSYDGSETSTDTNIKVRMVEQKETMKDAEGIDVNSKGHFYKGKEININYGDEIEFDAKKYKVIKIYKARWKDGSVLYTKVWFR